MIPRPVAGEDFVPFDLSGATSGGYSTLLAAVESLLRPMWLSGGNFCLIAPVIKVRFWPRTGNSHPAVHRPY